MTMFRSPTSSVLECDVSVYARRWGVKNVMAWSTSGRGAAVIFDSDMSAQDSWKGERLPDWASTICWVIWSG